MTIFTIQTDNRSLVSPKPVADTSRSELLHVHELIQGLKMELLLDLERSVGLSLSRLHPDRGQRLEQ
jgi:hypothetical protein